MTIKEPWPRDEEHRYRLYTLTGRRLKVVAAAPTLEDIGCAFGTCLAEEQIDAESRVGVLDTRGGNPSGTWVVNPYAKG